MFSKNDVFVLVFHISFKEETIGQDYNDSHVCYCLQKEEKVGIYLRGRNFGGKKFWRKQNLAELAGI